MTGKQVNELNRNEERENRNRTEPNTQRMGETQDTHVTHISLLIAQLLSTDVLFCNFGEY